MTKEQDILKKFILMYFRDCFRQINVRGQTVDEQALKVLIHRLNSDLKGNRYTLLHEVTNELKFIDLSNIVFSDLNNDVKAMLIKESDESNKHRNNVIKLVNSILNDITK